MTVLQWPAEARIKSNDLSLVYPGQIALQSPYTGQRQVINRSPGLWAGTVRIMEVSYRDKASIRAIESMLAQLRGQENVIEIPLNRGTFAHRCRKVFYIDPTDNKLYTLEFGTGRHEKVSDVLFPNAAGVAQEPVRSDKILVVPNAVGQNISLYDLETDAVVSTIVSTSGYENALGRISDRGFQAVKGGARKSYDIISIMNDSDIAYSGITRVVDTQNVMELVSSQRVSNFFAYLYIDTSYRLSLQIGDLSTEVWAASLGESPQTFRAADVKFSDVYALRSDDMLIEQLDVTTGPYPKTTGKTEYPFGKSGVQAMCVDTREENVENCGITVSSTSNVEGRLKVTFNKALTMDEGDYLRIGNRLYNYVESADSGTSAFLYPQAIPATGATVDPAPTVRARLSDEQPTMMVKNPDFAGPWVLNWVEAI